jgi:GTP cyclohydrolase I
VTLEIAPSVSLSEVFAGADAVVASPPGAAQRGGIDQPRIERAVREILLAIGEDPERDGLQGTPQRVARACAEVFGGLTQDPAEILATTFEAGHGELVVVREIAVHSVCEHHLAPFLGVAHVAYLPGPDGRVVGLSKVARLVDLYSRRPQVQERLTSQVAEAMMTHLGATGVLVLIECEHLCMSMRGVRKPGTRTRTAAARGLLADSPQARAEAMALVKP